MCLCFSISVLAQAKTVTGTVVDAIGEPIIGASVLEMGTTNGTITDVDGNFTLQVPEGTKLEVSFLVTNHSKLWWARRAITRWC